MNIGIIGTGGIGRLHAEAIRAMDGGKLHSIHHPDTQKSAALAAAYGVPCIASLADFLADPALDLVTVATPSGAHLDPCLAALAAGKHVLCEKPLEVSTARIDTLGEAAQRSGKTLSAILNRRFTPAMDAFKQACDQGRFGRVTSASCYVKWFRDQAYYDSAAWRGTRALDGGGALMNQGIHAVDALLHLAGPVRAVRALGACLAHERIEVEDAAVALLEFESGALGVIEASTCAWSEGGQPARIQICGTRGSAFLADERFEVWDFIDAAPGDDHIRQHLMASGTASLGGNDPKAITSSQHRRNFEEVVGAIRTGREPATTVREARKAVALIEAIYQSAAEGGGRILLA